MEERLASEEFADVEREDVGALVKSVEEYEVDVGER